MQVLNRHHLHTPWPANARYIGRGTPLGNPYRIGPDGSRDEVIEKYRIHLEAALREGRPDIVDALRGLREETDLVCSCAPRPCHGEVIRQVWQERFADQRPLVFVFGSNLAGRHGKGSAKYAREVFGALPGQGEGPQGSAYAIPTKDRQLRPLPLEHVAAGVRRFLAHAAAEPGVDFRITAIGTGLAGYDHADIAPMFRFAPRNCLLPEEWAPWIDDACRDRSVRLLVAGSRSFTDFGLMAERLDHLTSRLSPDQICLLSGTANGADTLGEQWARQRGIPCARFPARWDAVDGPHVVVRHRKGRAYDARAGHKRNAQMAACATHAVLFWDGRSAGTRNMRDLLAGMEIPHRIVRTDPADPETAQAPTPGATP